MNRTATPRSPEPPECDATFERLPWLVNGTLAPLEAFAVEGHVAHCPRCAARLARERELLRAIRRPTSRVERSPLAAWAQFERALAAGGPVATRESAVPGAAPALAVPPSTAAAGDKQAAVATAPTAAVPRLARWRGLRLALAAQAAAIVVLAVTLTWVLVARAPAGRDAAWRTVSSEDTSLPRDGAGWRVALDPTLPAEEAASLLERHGLRERGPLVAEGVHTVEALPGRVPAVEALRADPRVRLVEPLATAAAPGSHVP